ncbi:hypothetical protein [Chloroflexus sp.]|nr:hypothetical protein [Chloroflexus sp.]
MLAEAQEIAEVGGRRRLLTAIKEVRARMVESEVIAPGRND